MLNYRNLDLENIVTPVDVDKFELLLKETGYCPQKSYKLLHSFRNGFDLGYRGPENVQLKAPNLKLTIGSETELWNKVMKEVKLKRYAGPFREIPFKNYIQSPIGLVPKDDGKKTRLIFHLSYPKNEGLSVNQNTPEELKKVTYKNFDDALELCINCINKANFCVAGKSDMSSAFRHLGMAKKWWKYLVMKAKSPIDKKFYYFVDKCLPFGAGISCSHFQAFSDAVAHITKVKSGQENVNYLDDFFFAAICKWLCDNAIDTFLSVCKEINFPVSMEKTYWGTGCIVFLGLLIDLVHRRVFVPIEKVHRAKSMISYMLNKKNKKVTRKQMETLTGFLNFLGKAIVPGRAFTRRFYAHSATVLKPNHHIKVKGEIRMDLEAWAEFLETPQIYGRPFFQFNDQRNAKTLNWYTDATANASLGMGGICGSDWFIYQWDEDFIIANKPSINYLELFALVTSVLMWLHKFQNMSIILFCDNTSVVHMVNNTTSSCVNCMVLIRLLVIECMKYNTKIIVEHVKGKLNIFADLLSRNKYKEFWAHVRATKTKFNNRPSIVSDRIWPMEKVWVGDEL